MGYVSVFIGTTEYTSSNIYDVYFKTKLNQVGRFSFNVISGTLGDTGKSLFVEGAILQIAVYGTVRFEGFITNIEKKRAGGIWLVEGQSLGGILGTRSIRTPVVLRAGVNNDTITASQVVQQAVFRFGGFATTGITGWTVSATQGNGFESWLYKYESQPIINTVINAAKMSGYDWRVYLS